MINYYSTIFWTLGLKIFNMNTKATVVGDLNPQNSRHESYVMW